MKVMWEFSFTIFVQGCLRIFVDSLIGWAWVEVKFGSQSSGCIQNYEHTKCPFASQVWITILQHEHNLKLFSRWWVNLLEDWSYHLPGQNLHLLNYTEGRHPWMWPSIKVMYFPVISLPSSDLYFFAHSTSKSWPSCKRINTHIHRVKWSGARWLLN